MELQEIIDYLEIKDDQEKQIIEKKHLNNPAAILAVFEEAITGQYVFAGVSFNGLHLTIIQLRTLKLYMNTGRSLHQNVIVIFALN